MKIEFELNGKDIKIEVDKKLTLLHLLRDRLDLTGTKEGCGIARCGSCTVLVDGKAVRSCVLPASSLQGCKVTTIEGLAIDGELDPLQQAFIDNHAVQCGFCTPGMIMSAKALLLKNPDPSEDEILEAISANLCRCTGYKQIVKAIKSINSP